MPFFAPTRLDERIWSGNPVAASQALLATSAPPASPRIPTQWAFNLPPDQYWQWTNGWNADTLNTLVAGGTPTHKMWRYDYDVNPYVNRWDWFDGWNADVLLSFTLNTPFYKQWRYDLFPQPDWTFAPQPSTVQFDFSVNTPFVPKWRDDVEFAHPWQPYLGWNAAAAYWLTIGGEPFSREWRYDLVPDPTWQWVDGWGAPATVATAALAASKTPFKQLWRSDYNHQIGWTFSYQAYNPLPEESTLYSITATYQIPYVNQDVWLGAPSNNPLANPIPVAQTLPFRKLWREDREEVQPWQPPSGQNAGTAYLLTVGGEPFNRLWRWDHVPDPVQAWVPPAATKAVAQFYGIDGQAPTKLWRWDHVPEPVWPGQPTSRGIIFPLSANGEPFSRLWRWDHVPMPDWQWTPPNTTLVEPIVGKPFAKLRREDLVPEPVWTWPGAGSVILPDLATKPFNRLWRWDHVPEPFWAWEPGNVTINVPLPGNPKFRLWRWDHVPEPGWLWTPPRAGTIEETTLGGKPTFRLWRWDEVPEPVWTWTAPSSDALTQLVSAGEPFWKLWRWDIAEQLSWLWTPPTFIRRHGPPPRIDPLRMLKGPKLIRLLKAPPQDE